jgi:hypothetical protein
VIESGGSYERKWLNFDEMKSEILKLSDGRYEETLEKSYKYVLTIYMFNVSMNGGYIVHFGHGFRHTNVIIVKLSGWFVFPIIFRSLENKVTIHLY